MKSLCVSLETAKKLKAAGWTKPTTCGYYYNPVQKSHYLSDYADLDLRTFDAPTAEEVLRDLPSKIGDKNHEAMLDIRKIGYGFSVGYEICGTFQGLNCQNSLSETAAQMWLWCVENGYIKTEAKP